MRITIKAENYEGKDVSFNFTDEELDNYNFVDLDFIDDEGNRQEYTFCVDDLISLAEAFENKRMRDLERESLMN